MKKLLILFVILLFNIKLIHANYSINIDLSNSAFKIDHRYIKQEITPKDELIYDLNYHNKQSETLKLYLTLKYDQSKLLEKLKVQLYYQDKMIYEDSTNQLIENQYITTLKANHKDHLQIRLIFDENSNNQYTMQELNLYLILETISLDDIQTNDSSNLNHYIYLFLFSSMMLIILIKRSNKYEENNDI